MLRMKKLTKKLSGFVIIGLVIFVLAASPTQGFAQTGDPTPTPEGVVETVSVEAGDEISFTELGLEETTLLGPYDDMIVRFGTPPEWQLSSGASIQLDLAFYYDTQTVNTNINSNIVGEVFGGLLQVVYNGVTQTTVLLDERGDQSFSIPITPGARIADRDDGQHELRLNLISDESCVYGLDVIVVVKPTSRFNLPHTNTTVTADLSLLPRPIYQSGLIVPSQATIVIPDQPSNSELQAIFSVVSGLGRSTDEQLLFSLVPASQLPAELRDSTHLIFVGKPAAFSELGNIGFPVSPAEYTSAGGNAEDGIVQMAVSPWNSAKAAVVISGDTDQGVLKAAKAFSSGFLLGIEQPNLARIADVNPTYLTTVAAANRTFAELGYPTDTTEFLGIVSREIEFFIPPGQVPEGDSYVDLFYAHSTLLSYERSGIVVELNREPVGSAAFRDETSQEGNLRVKLPVDTLRPGRNRLRITFNLYPQDICAPFFTANLWFTLSGDSLLHLPLITIPTEASQYLLDLDYYPQFFSLGPSTDSVAFVVPQNDISAWRTAAQIAFNIGDDTEWTMAEPLVVFADNVPSEIRQAHDLIIVGRPSAQPILTELTSVLPASFESGSDVATLEDLQVTYRLPSGTDIGYIELVQSPWNANKKIMAVLGSSDTGVQWAGAALTTPELRGDLAGDFALVSGDQIVAIDTTLSAGSAAEIAAAVPNTNVEIPIPESTYVPERPQWVLPAIAGVVVLMIIIILVAGISTIRKRR